MSLTFAIADLHGRFDLLVSALHEIGDYGAKYDGPHTVVFLGDYIDRGPKSRAIIERLMRGPVGAWKWIVLKGNHEGIMLAWLRRKISWDDWSINGGGATLISYGQSEGEQPRRDVVPTEHIQWLERLPFLHVDQHRVFVHAGVDPTIALDQQTEVTLTWLIYPDGFVDGHGDRHVVHGHHQHAHGPELFAGRTNLDTFAWRTGRLVVGVFDDAKPGGPIDFIEVRGDG